MLSTNHTLVKRSSVLACAILVSACSGTDTRRQANQGFDYISQQKVAPLVIAEGLDTPVYTQRYVIPVLPDGAENRPVGAAVDVRSPVQILALSPLVRVDEGTDNVTVWFNSQSAQDNISDQVWSLLANFLAEKKVAIGKLDKANNSLETDWLVHQETFGETGDTSEYELKQRYKFTLLTGASKRTVGLKVDLIDSEEIIDGSAGDSLIELSPADSRRYAVQMLNLVNIYYESERIANNNKATQIQRAEQLKISFVEQQYPVITLNRSFDDAWRVLPLVLEKLGMDVEDEDKIAGNMLVTYDAPDSDYWAEQQLTPVTLDANEYRVQLGEVKGQTSLAFFGEDKQPLSAAQMSELFISIKDAAAQVKAENSED